MPSSTIPRNLRQARKAAHVTQQALADLLGMDRTSMSRIETGRRVPSPDQAAAIEAHFGVPAGHFQWAADPVLEETIRRIVAAIPPLTDEQRAALAGHLQPEQVAS